MMKNEIIKSHLFYLIRSLLINYHPLSRNLPLRLAAIFFGKILLFSIYALQPSRLIVRSGLDVPTFATRRLHACHHARAPSGGRWNCGREISGNFA
jgi:hypothetical protein